MWLSFPGFPSICSFDNYNNTKAGNGQMTPLWLAAKNGRIEIVRILVANGADVTTSDDQGRTALMQAKQEGHTGVVELLRQHGAKKTLHGAVASGNIDEVKRLISQGADVKEKIEGGITPLVVIFGLLCNAFIHSISSLVVNSRISWGKYSISINSL
jgi:ankyrin repeat protein